MLIDINKYNLKNINNKNKLKKIYDYIIIGTGPASAVLLNNLLKTKKNFSCRKR